MLRFHEVPFFEVFLLLPDGIDRARVGHEIVKGRLLQVQYCFSARRSHDIMIILHPRIYVSFVI
jgi:hypothetical protein